MLQRKLQLLRVHLLGFGQVGKVGGNKRAHGLNHLLSLYYYVVCQVLVIGHLCMRCSVAVCAVRSMYTYISLHRLWRSGQV